MLYLFQEACDAIRTPQHLCDLKVTYNRILDMYKQMKRANFETYVRNITCYKYRKVPKYIVLNNNRSRTVNEVNRWDYKRRKRLTRKHSSNRNLVKDKINLNNLKSNSLKRVDEQSSIEDIDDFETFYKGDDNIYRCKKRKRRNASMNDVKGEMRNLPSIPSDLVRFQFISHHILKLLQSIIHYHALKSFKVDISSPLANQLCSRFLTFTYAAHACPTFCL